MVIAAELPKFIAELLTEVGEAVFELCHYLVAEVSMLVFEDNWVLAGLAETDFVGI